jgi:organic hydroperoxide reductase OsmC/OhrA
MASNAHRYRLRTVWTGAGDHGTRDYEAYARDFRAEVAGKPPLQGSADPVFRDDASRHNPEDWMLMAVASCHMLFYLALCAKRRLQVLAYEDDSEATLVLTPEGGAFTGFTLRPVVTLAQDADAALALRLHEQAHERCFVARSCAVPIDVQPVIHHAQPA